jgi:large conductance mechanosensitive channel
MRTDTSASKNAQQAHRKGKQMLNEFKAFITRGNVLDLAVGVIIGAAFTAIVSSLVDDLINPLIGMIVGGIDFSALGFSIGEARFNVGNFINAVIKFLIIAWVVFMMVKSLNKLMPKKEEAPAAPTGPTELDVLKEILAAVKK